MSETVLVTGGAGFIGSNFVPYFLKAHPEITLVNLDKMTYAADEANLAEVRDNPRYVFVKGDITDKELVEKIFAGHDIRGVIHFAAESHVDNSIKGPEIEPFKVKKGYEKCRFHHISTDEVYGTLGETGFFTETTPYAPNSPYSASKASSDLLVRAYHHTYGMNVTTSNCSNNYGPKQHGEKLIPTIIRKCLNGENIPVYGDGKNIRDWLYVLDHCKAIDLIYRKGVSGETYNVGGRNERNNLQIVDTICAILDREAPRKEGKYKELVTFVKDRAGHDRRYAIDATKLETELGWKADENFDTGIVKTVEWYLKKYRGTAA